MRVVPAGPAHAAVIASLHGLCLGGDAGDAWSARGVRDLLALPGAFARLLTDALPADSPDSGPAIGFALCVPGADAVEIAALGVLPSSRRAGGGRLLLAAIGDHVRRAGGRRLLLEVAADNRAALALYRATGSRIDGRRRGYYANGADALLLSLDLGTEGPQSPAA